MGDMNTDQRVEALGRIRDALVAKLVDADEEIAKLQQGIYWVWTILANVSNGDWGQQPDRWREAAEKWRDEFFHKNLDRLPEEEPTDVPAPHVEPS